MCSSGKTPKILFALSFLLCLNSYGEDSGWIAMPGQLEDDYTETLKVDEKEVDPINGSRKKSGYLGPEADGESEFLYKKKDTYAGDDLSGSGGSNIKALGQVGTKSFQTITNDEILSKAAGQWTSSFGFAYLIDNYDYTDESNVYNSVYRNSSVGKNYGSILFKFREKVGGIFYFGVNAGAGYSSGKGFFIPDGVTISTPEVSNIEFKLYTVPVEISFGMKFNVGSIFNINVNAAGGAMGLWQSRDDRDQQDDSKNIRQIGFGYSAEGGIGINISRMYKQLGVDLLSDYQCTNFALDFFVRNQNYSNFKQADLTISGMSYGVGLTFDYL